MPKAENPDQRPKNHRIQSSVEYLFAYGVVVLILVIVIGIFFNIFSTSKGVVPTSCQFSSTIACSDIVLATNPVTSNTEISLLLVNSGTYALANPQMVVNLKSTNSSSSACLPNYVKPGGAILCLLNLPQKTSINEFVSGRFYLSTNHCGLSTSGTCTGAPTEIYSGDFRGSTQPSSTSMVSISLKAENYNNVPINQKDSLLANVVFYNAPLAGITLNFSTDLTTAKLDPIYGNTNASGAAQSSILSTAPGAARVLASLSANGITISSDIILIDFIGSSTTTSTTTTTSFTSTSSSTTTLPTTTSTSTTSTTTSTSITSTINYVYYTVPVQGSFARFSLFPPSTNIAGVPTPATDISLLTATPDGNYIYAAGYSYGLGTAVIMAFNTAAFTVTNVIHAGTDTLNAMSITPDGNYVYALSGSSIYVVSTATQQLIKTIAVGNGAISAAITPDDNYLYVTSSESNTVSVIAVGTWNVITTISVGKDPNGIVMDPKGNYAYVASKQDPNYYYTISTISTATKQVVNTLTLTNTVVQAPFSSPPLSMSITTDGSYIYVPDPERASVYAVSTAPFTVTNTIAVGSRPFAAFVTLDGKYVYAVPYGASPIYVINTTTQKVANTIAINPPACVNSYYLPSDPYTGPVAITHDGRYLYISDLCFTGYGSPIIDTSTQTLVGRSGYERANWISTTK